MSNAIVEGKTCFSVTDQFDVPCERRRCHQWLDKAECHCVLVHAARNPEGTHDCDIAELFATSRSAVCAVKQRVFLRLQLLQ
jgi:hypothetical protein